MEIHVTDRSAIHERQAVEVQITGAPLEEMLRAAVAQINLNGWHVGSIWVEGEYGDQDLFLVVSIEPWGEQA